MRPWQLITMILILGALAVTYGWKPFWILFYAMIVAFALAVAWLALSVRGLKFVRTSIGGRAQVGDRIEERLALENHSWVPKLWVQIADASTLPGHHAGYVSSVGPRQRISWRARTLCRQRGRFTLGPVVATTGDPLGLFQRELTLAPASPLLVLPKVIPLRAFALFAGVMPGRGRGSQRSLHTSTNAVTVRNYIPGDALTRIHWNSTARHGQLMVKEFDLDPTTDVVILLDLDRNSQAGEGEESTEEYGVTIAASLVSYLLRQRELAVSLEVPGQHGASLALDRGERQIERSLESLAVVHAQDSTPLAIALGQLERRLMRNTVLILVTASTDLDWQRRLAVLRRRGVRPFVILLEPSTFDSRRGGMAHVEEELRAVNAPYTIIGKGVDIGSALEGPAA